MNKEVCKIWKAAIYIRISKENGEDNLENQQSAVAAHLRMLGNIEVCFVKVDDGYSGLNTNRPAFQEMLKKIECGEIDCVAVRDLSRLSRNYIEAGRYIQEIFPKQGIRFISVYEGFDFIKAPEYNISAMVAFRNIVNEDYSYTLSQSVKNGLAQGYKAGKYLSAFTVYGYRKSSTNRHRLEIDSVAAKVVRDIFRWKLEGISAAGISEVLNQAGIPSPAEHKKYSNHHSFRKNTKTKWSPAAVKRILSNRIYTGCLEQGKSMRPYFKVNHRKEKPRNEWICVENTHEAIISLIQFETVARLLLMDTRNTTGEKTLPTLAGFVRCKKCGQNMILKQTLSKGKTYCYYVCCGKNQDKKGCPAYRISKAVLEEKVLHQLQFRIGDAMEFDERKSSINVSYINEIRKQEIVKELSRLSDELKINRRYLKGLYEDFALKILSRSDFDFMRPHYIKKCNVIEENIQTAEINILNNLDAEAIFGWIEQYRLFFSFDKITRPMLAYLVQRITVDDKKRVQVEFLHEQEYLLLCDAVKNL